MFFKKKNKALGKRFNPKRPIQDYFYQTHPAYLWYVLIQKLKGIRFTFDNDDIGGKITVNLTYNLKNMDAQKLNDILFKDSSSGTIDESYVLIPDQYFTKLHYDDRTMDTMEILEKIASERVSYAQFACSLFYALGINSKTCDASQGIDALYANVDINKAKEYCENMIYYEYRNKANEIVHFEDLINQTSGLNVQDTISDWFSSLYDQKISIAYSVKADYSFIREILAFAIAVYASKGYEVARELLYDFNLEYKEYKDIGLKEFFKFSNIK